MQKGNHSCTSTPFSDKENLCPNPKFNTVAPHKHEVSKKDQTCSINTDPDFNMFKTIQVQRQSNIRSITTKSRADMEAILENFSTKS